MIDIETMGQTPSAPIIAIGACEICALPETFYRVINLESACEAGGVIDPATVLWWLRQPAEARDEFKPGDGDEIPDVLLSFTRWLGAICPDMNQLVVWANGASFDFPILTESFRRCGMPRPWHFWNERDYRTIKALYPHLKADQRLGKHNALNDALTQAEHLNWLLYRQHQLETRVLWDSEQAACYLCTSARNFAERIACKPDFPKAIRLADVRGGLRWKAEEVMGWAESRREKRAA